LDFKEKCKNIRAFIVLLASLICWLLNIRYKRDLLESLIILVIVIAVFYVISTIALTLIDKIRNMEQPTKLPDDLPPEAEASDEE